jgi:thiol-disulfide isomerase/thioredoxin
MVAVGEEAPDFTLETDEAKQVSLKDYRGKKVVLYFYPKDGTPGCTTEALEFKDVAEQFAKEDAVILGISKDEVESHQEFKNPDFISKLEEVISKIYKEGDAFCVPYRDAVNGEPRIAQYMKYEGNESLSGIKRITLANNRIIGVRIIKTQEITPPASHVSAPQYIPDNAIEWGPRLNRSP